MQIRHFALLVLLLACRKDRDAPAPAAAPAIEISILYGSEKKTWLEEQLAAFNAAPHARPIRITAKAIGSGDAMQAILAGDQPTVFSPASTAYLALLDQQWQARAGHPRPIAAAGEPLVLSPIVIAMWKPMAEVLGWPDKPIGWSDLLAVSRDPGGWATRGHPEWGPLKLGHTHPESSSSGLLTALAIAYAGAHTTRGLTAEQIAAVEPFLASVEDAIVHYGKSTGFFADKMIERGPSYLSAAVLYENLVIESYANANRALDLVALYPQEGTFWADHPFSILDAPWVTADQRAAAGELLRFLKARPAQERALALGFRPADPAVKIGAPIDRAHGVDAAQPQTLLEVPDAGTLDALLAAWRRSKKPADVVLVLDKSGSMTGRPLTEAKRGAKAFLAALDARDRVTLLFFDGQLYPAIGPVELGAARADLEARIDGVSASGGTALYDAALAAHDLLAARKKTSSHHIRAVVVMTDGGDTDSKKTFAQALQGLHAEDDGVAMFTLAYGDQPNREALQQLAQAGAGAFSQGDVDTILQTFRDLAAFF